MSGGFHRLVVIAAAVGLCATTGATGALAKDPAAGRVAPSQHAFRTGPGQRVAWSRLPKRSPGEHRPLNRPALRPTAAAPPAATAAVQATRNLELPRSPAVAASQAVYGQTPELLTKIAGVSRSQQIQQLGSDQATLPPDTQIAVGPDAVLELTNSSFTVWSKAGLLLGARDLNVFFGVPAGYWAGDPKVLYDSGTGRWFASALAVNAGNASQAYVAVSAGPDPMGTWYVYSTTISADLFDQPKIGVTSDKLVLSWNEYSGTRFVGQVTQVLQKTDLLSGGALNVIVFSLDNTRFNLVPAAGSRSTTAYLVYNGNSLRGSAYAGAYIGVVAISGTPLAGNVVWTESDPSIGATNIPPSARQPQGAPNLDAGDDRFESAAQTGGTISVMGNDACVPIGDSSVRSCLRLVQVPISGPATALADVRYGSPGTDLFYPAVATDGVGNLFSAFSASSPSLYAGAYAGVQSVGLAATLTLGSLQPGMGVYNYAPCSYSNRWGDYSAAALDPTDPTDIWLAAEYADTATDSCNWGTAFGRLTLAAPMIKAIAPTSGPVGGGTVVTLTGSDFVQGATTVMFGAVGSTSVTVQSPNALTAVAPPEIAGTVDVTAATADGTSAPVPYDRFTFIDTTAPTVQSVTVSPSNVSAGESAAVGIRVSDPDGTVSRVSVRYSSVSAPLGTAAYANLSLVSGNGVDGIWQATIAVPSSAGSGAWTVYEVIARDVAGNTTDIVAPSPPTGGGSFFVTRMTRLVGQTVGLPRGDAPPPSVGSLRPLGAPANAAPRTSIIRELRGVTSSPASSPLVNSYGRGIRDAIDSTALHAMSLLLAVLRHLFWAEN